MCKSTLTRSEGAYHIQAANSKWLDEWDGLQGRRRLVGHIGIELATFIVINDIFGHLISMWPTQYALATMFQEDV